ncbi:MAG: hypothetical protein H6R26_2090, partial [Proteobacteria bacterium]|nr:hypothetical protein [Pseudomonadota bacterium]
MTLLSDLARGVLGDVLQGSAQGQNLQAGFMDLLE